MDRTQKEILKIIDLYQGFFTNIDFSKREIKALMFAHIEHECNFEIQSERFNYSVKRFRQIFGNHYPEALEVLKHRVKGYENEVANIIYCCKNGNVYKKDGSRFKGRGFIQLTGRGNYREISDYIKNKIFIDFQLEKFPDILLGDIGLNVIVVMAFFDNNKIDNFERSIKKINPRMGKKMIAIRRDSYQKWLSYI